LIPTAEKWNILLQIGFAWLKIQAADIITGEKCVIYGTASEMARLSKEYHEGKLYSLFLIPRPLTYN